MSYPISLQQLPKQQQSLKQTQRLIMSPQMQQAIHLLQMPIQEIETLIEAELEQNPILENDSLSSTTHDLNEQDEKIADLEDELHETILETDSQETREVSFEEQNFEVMKMLDDDFRDYIEESNALASGNVDEKKRSFMENSICAEDSLFEHLVLQINENFDDVNERKIAEIIAGNIDQDGLLTTPLEEISLQAECPLESVKTVLAQMQTFHPPGIAATSLQETLLIQLKLLGKQNTLAYRIIANFFDSLLHNHLPYIAKQLNVTPQDISEAIESTIRKLELHPGSDFSHPPVQMIVPDATIRIEDNQLIVDVNDDYSPGLRLSNRYMRMLDNDSLPKETKDFIHQKIISAKWLIKNLFQRHNTIYRITELLTKHNTNFFLSPDGKLNPLTMKKVADELELHESTIARAVANKYVNSPRGIFPLRSFFTNAYVNNHGENVSSKTVRDLLLELVNNENKSNPLSDESLSLALKNLGIPCARRTIAKYRQELQIGNKQQRRKFST